jgi:hypothetical protein
MVSPPGRRVYAAARFRKTTILDAKLVARITSGDDVVSASLMSRPSGKLIRREPAAHDETRPRRPDSGIARAPGLLVAAVTAAIVFVIGQQLFPIKPKQFQPPPPPAPTAAPETPPPTAPVPAADAASQANAAAGDASAGAAATAPVTPDAGKAAVAEQEPPAEPTKPADEPPAEDAATASPERKLADKQKQADRELAREAWRRNRPDISVVGTKTSILVPIRGSIKGADFKILRKSRTVVVSLPKAVSMITLRVYNLKHPSFKKLWIDQDEANAQPKDGTKLRLILSQTFDPQVEITDDFVRVTIRRPESAGDSAEEKHRESRGEKHGKKDSAEQPSEPSEDAAPAPEKEKD